MIKNLLKQIWNERRANTFLWVELFVVFVVLWYIVDLVYVTLSIYNMPMGFNIDNTYLLRVNTVTEKAAVYQPGRTMEQNVADLHEIVDRLSRRPDVEAIGISQNSIPYNDGANVFSFYLDSVCVRGLLRWVTPGYFRVYRYQNIDGSGWESLEKAFSVSGLIVPMTVADPYPDAPVHGRELLGRRVPVRSNEPDASRLTISAVTEPVRYDHFTAPDDHSSRYMAVYITDNDLISLGDVTYLEISIRVREGQNEGFPDRLMADADSHYRIGNLYIQDITPLSDIRESYEMDNVNELRTRFCIMFFLLLNIFLGIIGTFWFRTRHRRSEVALRMAVGSTRWGVCGRLMGEGLFLLLLSAVPAVIVTFNIGYAELVEVGRMPFTAERFVVTILDTFALIALMIVMGVWYPARRAMNIRPAEALYEE